MHRRSAPARVGVNRELAVPRHSLKNLAPRIHRDRPRRLARFLPPHLVLQVHTRADVVRNYRHPLTDLGRGFRFPAIHLPVLFGELYYFRLRIFDHVSVAAVLPASITNCPGTAVLTTVQ